MAKAGVPNFDTLGLLQKMRMHGAVALAREQRDDSPKRLLEESDAGNGAARNTPLLRVRKNERGRLTLGGPSNLQWRPRWRDAWRVTTAGVAGNRYCLPQARPRTTHEEGSVRADYFAEGHRQDEPALFIGYLERALEPAPDAVHAGMQEIAGCIQGGCRSACSGKSSPSSSRKRRSR